MLVFMYGSWGANWVVSLQRRDILLFWTKSPFRSSPVPLHIPHSPLAKHSCYRHSMHSDIYGCGSEKEMFLTWSLTFESV